MSEVMEKIRYPRALALEVAREMCAAIKPICDRLDVAGSLRRMKQEVGDVEIVYIPQFESRPVDMFRRENFDLVTEKLHELMAQGIITKRPGKDGVCTWGDMNKFAIHTRTGVPIDFFRTSDEKWFNYLVCRTGSAETNKRIATAAQAKRLRWLPYGAGFMDDYDRLIKVESEEDVFRIVGLEFKEPKDR